jgi:beta-ribofuranosylaminobenzene 5'-phosphate synthase
MICVTTGSRLHFGLFSVPGTDQSQTARQFGGVGLLVEKPGVQVRAWPASTWSATGPLAQRALAFAQKFVAASSEKNFSQAFRLQIDFCAPEHMGLGTGTQLGLAVGQALAQAAELDLPTEIIAQRLDRGQRSALGIHGFRHGGFLVEGGKGPNTTLSPLLARVPFPDTWPVLLIMPRNNQGLHGQPEKDAFTHLAQRNFSPEHCDILCRLTLLGMLPALHENDLPTFGEALYEFNHRVGEMFQPAQGGPYGNPLTEALVHFLCQQGIRGTGQSSWGPTVFAILEPDQANHLIPRLIQRFTLEKDEILLTQAQNHGARISRA